MSPYRTARFELGPLEARYGSPVPVRPLVLFFVIFGAPGVALLTGFQSARGQVFAGDRLTNGVLGAALLVFAGYLGVIAGRKSTLSVAVHRNGLVWRERGRSHVVPWDQLVSITGSHRRRGVVGMEVARTHVYRLVTKSGRELVATNMLGDVIEFAERVERALEARLPAWRAALDEGRSLEFGPLRLDAKGVLHEGRLVRFADLAPLEVENGMVKAGPLEVAWDTIPNAPLFLALASERRATAG